MCRWPTTTAAWFQHLLTPSPLRYLNACTITCIANKCAFLTPQNQLTSNMFTKKWEISFYSSTIFVGLVSLKYVVLRFWSSLEYHHIFLTYWFGDFIFYLKVFILFNPTLNLTFRMDRMNWQLLVRLISTNILERWFRP